jgi:hypothetical protein
MSGMAPAENRIPKSETKQVIRNTEEETKVQEEKAENAEDSKQNPKHLKKMKLERVGNYQIRADAQRETECYVKG